MHFEGDSGQKKLEQKNTGCLHKNPLNPNTLAEHLLCYGDEILRQMEGAQYIGIINRSLRALSYLKKGERDEALTIGENAYQDALLHGGIVTPICEMILGLILLEMGKDKEAGERWKNSAALLIKMARQITPENSSRGKLRPINLEGRGSNRLVKIEPGNYSEARSEDGSYLFRIQMFGSFRVFHRQEEIKANWRTVKSRDLLAYLAHWGKPVSTGQILEDLWPDLDADKASAVFHTTLYYLRQLIQRYTKEEIIIYGSRRYQLRPGSVLIDRYQFEEAMQRALGKTMTETLANELETTAALYRGDYLEDLDYQWVIPVQEKLKNINISLKQELAGYYLKNKMYSRALVHIRQLRAEDPYSEEVLRLLLATLAGKGDLLAVKKEYTAFAKTLFEELGIQPSYETKAFFKELCQVKSAIMYA
ncbi:MAG TPA: hypothetical protein GXZ98_02995 [Firmicutes bacterium]|jgi:two-component SAPR family response regulator|nr:hypothetical protein [Bacillota bacterium]